MVVVDTSVWVDFFNGKLTDETEKLDHYLSSTVIVIGDLILAEVLQGFRSDKDYRIAKSLLTELQQVRLCNTDLAIKSAQNYRALRKQGITIRKTIDCLIATYCVETKTPLLFSDRDFDPWVAHLQLKDASVL
ncbi:PIN domain nuclease [Nitrosomonas sp. sh817]|uniref:type II toxin-antitoxin system VapC family toxin n=1 Tax=Nitrosomonas sp. sh817 TaxID=3070658 RepID=UPI0027DC990B|nr:PIN domain nuclease [Nitrosomonas sp. sh817]WMJ08185.1 PIN domain nuclease [Nitrosomonas sp. sh817]